MRSNKTSKFPFVPINTTDRNKNGLPVASYGGHTINLLGAGYNCPSLGLFGYSTESAIKRAIDKKLSNEVR